VNKSEQLVLASAGEGDDQFLEALFFRRAKDFPVVGVYRWT
jgi:hypothetical protein